MNERYSLIELEQKIKFNAPLAEAGWWKVLSKCLYGTDVAILFAFSYLVCLLSWLLIRLTSPSKGRHSVRSANIINYIK